MIADSAELRPAVRIDRRRNCREVSLWAGIAILDVVMLVLCAMSTNLDLRPAQPAVMFVGP
jgi:hypothetical protein